MFAMRFDMRAPAFGAPTSDLYAAALDMAAWAEKNGCVQLVVSEHHASPDGYLPVPMLLASAFAARTQRIGIQIAAVIVPLHDPIELAEQMAVLDVISGGRVTFVCGVGYREEEFAMFGQPLEGRGKRMESALHTLRKAWTGEPFEYQGRPVCVTPRPVTPGGPPLMMGGGSRIAARRAARFGMGILAQGSDDPEFEKTYRDACAEYGTTPGLFINPAPTDPTCVFVSKDVERSWRELGPHLLHDAREYRQWLGHASAASGSGAQSVADLRAEQGVYRIFTPEEAIAHVKAGGILALHPLVGGLAPETAWEHLGVVENEVLPALS